MMMMTAKVDCGLMYLCIYVDILRMAWNVHFFVARSAVGYRKKVCVSSLDLYPRQVIVRSIYYVEHDKSPTSDDDKLVE